MSTYTYGVNSPIQHLQQARHELAQLERLQDTLLPEDRKDEPAYLARTIATTIWHISDAVMKTEDPVFVRWRIASGVKRIYEFQEQMRKTSKELRLCWELCNGSKHLEKKPAAEVDETTMSGVPMARGTSWYWQKRKYRPKIVIKATGERVRAVEVFAKAIADWQDFFDRNGLTG
jgi:hypothetical protein